MRPQFASYLIHAVPQLPDTPDEFARLRLFDAALDTLTHEPQLWGVVLADSVAALEDYLSLRPEQFDRLAAFGKAGRIDAGVWYAPPGAWMESFELALRNLKLGRDTLALLGIGGEGVTAWGEYPLAGWVQAAHFGFDLTAALSAHHARPHLWAESPNSRAVILPLHPHDTPRPSLIAGASGQHIGVRVVGEPSEWLDSLYALRERLPLDEVFWSNRRSFIKAGVAALTPPPDHLPTLSPQSAYHPPTHPLARRMLETAEPLAAWGMVERVGIAGAGGIMTALWRGVLRALSSGQGGEVIAQRLESFIAAYPAEMPALVVIEGGQIHITAIKPRDDGRPGVIIRLYNPGESAPIVLHTWRRFTRCDVLKVDERYTGAQLPILEDGTVTFTHHSGHLLTLAFSD